jgi:hypothetical protein
MPDQSAKLNPWEIDVLLRGDLETISPWLRQANPHRLLLHVVAIVVGAGCYGAAMGWWRDPQQAIYIAIKLPLIILLTTLGSSLLNAMFAPLLGLDITIRQSISLILMSFTIAATILGAFSPLIAFVVWNAPGMASKGASDAAYNFILPAHVLVIALAGIAGNIRLFQLLKRLAGSPGVASRVLLAWLAVNLFLGAQLSWNLRPFVGAPGLPVEFLRRNAFQGNFYEAVFHALQQIFITK